MVDNMKLSKNFRTIKKTVESMESEITACGTCTCPGCACSGDIMISQYIFSGQATLGANTQKKTGSK